MTSKSSTPTFRDAVARYKASAADYEKPDKAASSRKGEAWLLNASDKRLLAIVQDTGDVLHGATLNAYYRQLSEGMQAPSRTVPEAKATDKPFWW